MLPRKWCRCHRAGPSGFQCRQDPVSPEQRTGQATSRLALHRSQAGQSDCTTSLLQTLYAGTHSLARPGLSSRSPPCPQPTHPSRYSQACDARSCARLIQSLEQSKEQVSCSAMCSRPTSCRRSVEPLSLPWCIRAACTSVPWLLSLGAMTTKGDRDSARRRIGDGDDSGGSGKDVVRLCTTKQLVQM